MLAALFDGHDGEILASPGYRLHILAVRGRGLLARDTGAAAHARASARRRSPTSPGAGTCAISSSAPCSTTRASARRSSTTRRVAGDLLPASGAAPIRFDAFHTHAVALDRDNLREALVASAAIPMVIEAVPDIPRAPAGVYWDGGLIDYHLHLPYSRSEGLGALPPLHRPHRARLARQGAAVAARARRVAGQRRARIAPRASTWRSCPSESSPTAATSGASSPTTRARRALDARRSRRARGWATSSSPSRNGPNPGGYCLFDPRTVP